MKISHLTMRLVRMTLRTAFETSFGRIDSRDCIILEAHTPDGLVGYGEGVADFDPGYSYETSATDWIILQDFILPAILGRQFDSPEAVARAMDFVRGNPMAKAGVEMAFWDLFGKQQGRSLKEMFGGVHDCVQVGVSVGLQESPQRLVEVVQGYLDQGYTRIKIKIKPGRDVGDTLAVRQAFPKLRLQVDANSAYRLDTAAALHPLDDLDLLLIEQPLDEDDLWDHAKLQKDFSTPICLDESILSARHARQALEMGACRIINIKAGRVGGLSEGLKIHTLCRAQNIPVWCGGMLETGVGRASNLALASLPGFTLPGDISASARYFLEDIITTPFTLNPDSTITVPTAPGLGIEIDYSALDRVTVRQETYRS